MEKYFITYITSFATILFCSAAELGPVTRAISAERKRRVIPDAWYVRSSTARVISVVLAALQPEIVPHTNTKLPQQSDQSI